MAGLQGIVRGGVDVTRKDLEILAGTSSRTVCHVAMLELYPVGKEERHIQICILPGTSITRMN